MGFVAVFRLGDFGVAAWAVAAPIAARSAAAAIAAAPPMSTLRRNGTRLAVGSCLVTVSVLSYVDTWLTRLHLSRLRRWSFFTTRTTWPCASKIVADSSDSSPERSSTPSENSFRHHVSLSETDPL